MLSSFRFFQWVVVDLDFFRSLRRFRRLSRNWVAVIGQPTRMEFEQFPVPFMNVTVCRRDVGWVDHDDI